MYRKDTREERRGEERVMCWLAFILDGCVNNLFNQFISKTVMCLDVLGWKRESLSRYVHHHHLIRPTLNSLRKRRIF